MPAFPARSEAEWRQVAETALKGASLDRLVSATSDGIALGPLHAGRTGPRALRGEPGAWKALCRLDHPGADAFNAQAREDLENGADGLTVVFAGSGAAYGFGLARWDSASLHKAFDGVPLDAGTRFTLDVGDFAQAEAVAALVERSGVTPSRVDMAFGFDPLGRIARTGAAGPDEATLRAAADDLSRRGFSGPFAAADARCIHDAGGTSAQELAFALSAGLSYLRALEDPAAIEFRLAADADQFATLAKFRAMRLLWSRVEQACGLTPAAIRLSASSAWRMMTAVEPFVNVMRAASAAFAAGLGGADNVTLLPFSQAAGLPDAFARRLARNTQIVELREARLGQVADPAAGAGGIEALTEGLCEKAWALFQSFEAAGGLEKALQQGFVQNVGRRGVRGAEARCRPRKDLADGRECASASRNESGRRAARRACGPGRCRAGCAPGFSPLRTVRAFARAGGADGTPYLPRRDRPRVGAQPAAWLRARVLRGGRRLGRRRNRCGKRGGTRRSVPSERRGRRRAFAAPTRVTGKAPWISQKRCEAPAPWRFTLPAGPATARRTWRAAGVDSFIYAGVDLLAVLEGALSRARE